jgi:alginate O-acetyltransferase complex protein AlgI
MAPWPVPVLGLARVSLCDAVPDWVDGLGCDARFNTKLFLVLFLPLTLALYWSLRGQRAKLVWITAASLAFYSLWDARFLLLLLGAGVANYWFGLAISGATRHRKAILVATIVANLALLGLFKYARFAADNARGLLQLLGMAWEPPAYSIILPLGISFFTFKAISYCVDVYRGEVAACRRPLVFLAFISLFPELVAGPIVRYQTLAPQLEDLPRSVVWPSMALGVSVFAIGLFKKVVVADSIARQIDGIWGADGIPGFGQAWTATLGYTLQVYFDFSGYSDMAMGLGAMLGLRFPINFNAPNQARNPSDFWSRWHISLSTWFRDYLYIPLGGSRKGEGRTQVNLLLVMAIGGLWHGAAWTFVLWGLYNGAWLVLYHRVRGSWDRAPAALQVVFTFGVIAIGRVLFRAPDLDVAVAMYKGLLSLPTAAATLPAQAPVLLALVAVTAASMLMRSTAVRPYRFRARDAAVTAGLLAASLLMLGGGDSPFLYYQF